MIVFFDGVCGLCNHVVDWLLARDVNRRLRFAPLQGETARKMLFAGESPARLDSIIFWREGQVFKKSDAVVEALCELGGGWRWCSLLRWIPRVLRDAVYDLVAVNRYQLFGRSATCRIPTPEERASFLP